MLDLTERHRFLLKAIDQIRATRVARAQHLERDRAARPLVVSAIDARHSAGSDQTLDDVAIDLVVWTERALAEAQVGHGVGGKACRLRILLLRDWRGRERRGAAGTGGTLRGLLRGS